MARVHVVVPESVHLAAKHDAQTRGVTLKAYVIAALRHETEAGRLASQPRTRPTR